MQVCRTILMLNFILKIQNMAFIFIILEMLGMHQYFIYNVPIIYIYIKHTTMYNTYMTIFVYIKSVF